MEKKYYPEIDALKGWAIFIVILVHSIIVYPINLHNNTYCKMLFDFGASFEMPLFFLISGFCFSYNNDYRFFISKKFKRIAIPYFVFFIFDMCLRCLIPSFVNKKRNLIDSIIGMFCGNTGPYWFLYCLFIIFAIYPFFFEIIKKTKNKSMPYSFLFMYFILSCSNLKIEWLRLNSVALYLFWFALGQQLKCWWKFDEHKITSISKRCFIVFLVLLLQLFLLFGIQYNHILLEKFITCLGIVFSFLLVQFDGFKRFFEDFGKYSLQLYLFNGFFLTASRVLICNYFHITNPIIIITSITMICFFVSYFVIKYVCSKFKIMRAVMGM